MKVALLDRRFGTHDERNTIENWKIKKGIEWYTNQSGQGNTYAFIDAFGKVTTGPLEVGADYSRLKDFDLLYLRIRSSPCAKATKQLRETCSKPVIIGYSDELVGANINNMSGYEWLREASEHVDVMTSSFPEKYDRPKHEGLGIKNWMFCPYGSDVYHWNEWAKPLSEKKNIVSGMWHIRSFMRGGYGDRLHSRTFLVMKSLQEKFGVECRFFLNFDGWKQESKIREYTNSLRLNVELVKHVPNSQFNSMLAESKIFMEEYQCPNYSRATVVSASVGTPQIGTDMNTPSNKLFPEVTTTHGDWDIFLQFAERLLVDKQFYLDVQRKGLERTEYFYYPALRERILKLYNKYKRVK